MPIRVAVLSDSHVGATSDGMVDPLEALRASVAAFDAEVDLALLPGDISDSAADHDLRAVRAVVAELGAPILAIPGNHDTSASVGAVFESPAAAAVAVGVAGWRVVLVDTVVAGEIHGAVAVDRVAEVLGPDHGVPTLIVLHHPPIAPSTHAWFQLHGGAALVGHVTQRSDVRAVLSGHLHAAFHLKVGATQYIGAPSTWYAIRHSGERYELDPEGALGGLLLTLGDDGSLSAELRRRSPV